MDHAHATSLAEERGCFDRWLLRGRSPLGDTPPKLAAAATSYCVCCTKNLVLRVRLCAAPFHRPLSMTHRRLIRSSALLFGHGATIAPDGIAAPSARDSSKGAVAALARFAKR